MDIDVPIWNPYRAFLIRTEPVNVYIISLLRKTNFLDLSSLVAVYSIIIKCEG